MTLSTIRRAIVHPVQHCLDQTGLLKIIANRNASSGAIVLMYHSVAAVENGAWIDPRNRLTPAVFERQMQYLAERRHVISLSELTRSLVQGRPCATGSVVITFDDGYLDNLTVAAPILDRLQLPATLFLPTGYIDRSESQWIDVIYSIFRFRTQHCMTTESPTVRDYDLRMKSDFASAYSTIRGILLEAPYTRRTQILNLVRQQLQPAGAPPRLTMTWDDVRHLKQRYPHFEIGCHTVNHVDLTNCGEADAKDEIWESRARIETETQASPRHFSFPYGRSSTTVRELVASNGFESACNSSGSPLIAAAIDIYGLPRVEAPRSCYRFGFLTSAANSGLLYRIGR